MPEIVRLLNGIPEGYQVPKEIREEYTKQQEMKQLDERRKRELSYAFPEQQQEQEAEPEQLEPYDTSEESPIGTLARGGARSVARGIESVVGAPGELINLLGDAVGWLGGAKTKMKDLRYNYLPTSENIRKNVTQKLTGSYLEPTTKTEEVLDDISGLASSLIAGNPKKLIEGGFKQAAKYAGKKVLLAAGAEALGQGTEALTGSPLAGSAVKVGTLVASSLVGGKKEISNLKKQQYGIADKIAEEKNLQGNSAPVRKKLAKIKEKLDKAYDIDSNARKEMDEFIGQIEKNLPADVTEAVTGKAQKKATQAISQAYQEAAASGKPVPKVTTETLTKPIKKVGKLKTSSAMKITQSINDKWKGASKGEKTILHDLNQLFNSFIDESAKKAPDFLNAWNTGKEIHQAESAIPAIWKSINENLTFKKAAENIKPLSYLGGVIKYGLGTPGIKGATALLGGLITAKEGANLYYVLKNSPKAWQAWTDFILAGNARNGIGMVNAFKKLDKAAAAVGR